MSSTSSRTLAISHVTLRARSGSSQSSGALTCFSSSASRVRASSIRRYRCASATRPRDQRSSEKSPFNDFLGSTRSRSPTARSSSSPMAQLVLLATAAEAGLVATGRLLGPDRHLLHRARCGGHRRRSSSSNASGASATCATTRRLDRLDPWTGIRGRAVLRCCGCRARGSSSTTTWRWNTYCTKSSSIWPIIASNMSKPSRCHSESGSC